MNALIDRFLEALNAGKVSECIQLSTFDTLSAADITMKGEELNSKLISHLKDNLYNLKGKYLYDFVIGAYMKATRFSFLFSASEMILKDGEPSMDAQDDLEKQALHPVMHVDMFYLSMSHLIQLMSQKLNSMDQKQLVVSILRLIGLFAENKEIQSICRRQKFISNFLKLFSDIVLNAQSNELITADESHISVLVSHIIAKLALRSKKNQEYLIRKKAHELFQPVLLVAEKNPLIFTACVGIMINLASSGDARLLLWSNGIVGVCKQLYSSCQGNPAITYLVLILLSRLTHECAEVIQDLMKDTKGFFDQFERILTANQELINPQISKPESIMVFALSLSIVRKIASLPQYYSTFLKQYFKHPLHFLTKYAFVSTSANAAAHAFAIRESLALLGLVFLDEQGRQFALLSYPKIPTAIIKLAVQVFEDSKIVKFALGCLTNLSLVERNKEDMSKENEFYVLICQTMDRYDFSDQMIVNCLKLMLNNCSNTISSKNFASPVILLKLLFLGFAYLQHAQITDLISKLIKMLCPSSSPALSSLVKCYREFEISNSKYRFATVILAQIKIMFTKNQSQSMLDLLSLLASLCAIDKLLVKELQEKSEFVTLIKDILQSKQSNPKELQKFSSALAYFPLEEFKGLLTF